MRQIVFATLAFFNTVFCFDGAVAQGVNQSGAQSRLPLKKISLFSSGVGYFEHSGVVEGNMRLSFSFTKTALNDALKSLVINDLEAGSPQVNYLSDSTLSRTLQSLKIDLSGDPGLLDILRSLKGIEIVAEVRNASGSGTSEIRGKIAAVERAGEAMSGESRPMLSLSTPQGMRNISIVQLQNFYFTDLTVQNDLTRALELISMTGAARTRELDIDLTGRRRREVTVSYVIPTPVWKISYRLDLNQNPPLLQSWAIIDNDGDVDWEGTEVTLVSGRPVSFVQPLYPPYYTARPMLPLAGAGIAQAETHESGWGLAQDDAASKNETALDYAVADSAFSTRDKRAMLSQRQSEPMAAMAVEMGVPMPMAPQAKAAVTGGGAAAAARTAGEQFEWTLKKPVVLQRQRSAMLPLFDGAVAARKLIIFSGQRALAGTINPAAGVEITNSTGQKLPAGSMTVFDGGSYAGDALTEFMTSGEKRLVTFGEDLSVSGSARAGVTSAVDTVKISKGLFTLNRKLVYKKTYTIRNAASEVKRLIVEHPINQGAKLTNPTDFSEQTANLYRFEMDLQANQVLIFDVQEETPVAETYMLANFNTDALLVWTNNSELSEKTRDAFRETLRLKNDADNAKKSVRELESQRDFFIKEQERIRANLQAVGSGTPEGKKYLDMLTALDGEIAASTGKIESARSAAQSAQSAYESYITALEL